MSSEQRRTPARPRDTLRQLVIALLLAATLTLIGAVGYHRIEGWSWADSFYMVVITLSTVGFSEVHPLSEVGRLWTVFLVVGGVTIVGYTVARGIELVTEGSLNGYRRQRRMNRRIDTLRDHFVVCGYGRVGRQVVEHFLASGRPLVVIDREDANGELRDSDIPHLLGNAEHESVLREAGIERAAGLVSAVDSDTENVFITLTARQLNPNLRIIARASTQETARKLQLVGAERVVSPYVASGRRMAHLALSPHAVDFFDVLSDPLKELAVEVHEIEIAAGGRLGGRTLREIDLRRSTGVIVVALRRAGGIELNPDPDARLDPGSRLLALGTMEQCRRLIELNVAAAR